MPVEGSGAVFSPLVDDVRIRTAVAEDLPAAEALWAQLQAIQSGMRPLGIDRDPDEQFRTEFRTALDPGSSVWLIAETAGTVVAMAHLHPERPSRVSDEEVLELSRVAVDAAWRGRGLGRLLVAEAERIARERGMRFLAARIFSRNESAVAFWDGLGFESFVDTRLKPVGDA